MKHSLRYWGFLLATAAAIIMIDQISKNLVLEHIPPGATIQPIPALVPFFQITHSSNTGMAFGMLANAGDLLLLLALVIVGVMLLMYSRLEGGLWLTRLAIGLVVGGALGNIIDRLQHGYVVDFVHLTIPGLISNVSNLADHAIVLGVLTLLATSWWRERQTRHKAAEQTDPAYEQRTDNE